MTSEFKKNGGSSRSVGQIGRKVSGNTNGPGTKNEMFSESLMYTLKKYGPDFEIFDSKQNGARLKKKFIFRVQIFL